jgi:molybdopterin-guanine dinucleotide biosynthesis protein MobB
MLDKARKPIVGFAAYSGTGKTTLLKEIIPLLRGKGIRVGVIKHAHHSFDIDTPGKDSYELRMAGASQTLIASAQREALVVERESGGEADLGRLLERLDQDSLDMILVEGFKDESFPKIELYRRGMGKPPFFPRDADIVAIATDCELPVATHLPVLNINAADQIVDFLCRRANLVYPATDIDPFSEPGSG